MNSLNNEHYTVNDFHNSELYTIQSDIQIHAESLLTEGNIGACEETDSAKFL
jgi:hypothetical protein